MSKAKFKQVIDYKQSLFNQLEYMHLGVDNYLNNLDKFTNIDPIMLLAKTNAIVKRHLPYIKVKKDTKIIRIKRNKEQTK
jgi:hypothetical protein